MFSKAAKNRRRDFKKGIDNDDARRKREENQDMIRKSKREEQIAKRRQRAVGQQAAPDQPARGRDPAIEQKLAHIPQLVQAVHSQDEGHILNAVQQFRKLLSIERDPPIQEVIDCGIVPKLVEFLSYHRNHMLQFEAAWALTNIASGTTRHTRVVIENNAVPLFVQQLRSQNADVREQAVWALGNIAGDSQQCRDLVLQAGAMQPLLSLCTADAKLSMLRNATWTLSNFCRGKPQPAFDLVSPALPTLGQLIYHKDDEVLTDACWALSYLSDDNGPNNAKIQAVLQSGVARRLVELLLHKSPNVKTPALRTVGNIVTGDDLQTQVILNCSVLTALQTLLNSPKRGIRKETCWTISNITAGNPDQIGEVIKANIIPPLIATLRTAEFDIQKEAAWAISNATSGGSDEQIRYLVEQGAIPPLCELLKCPDSKIIMVALEGIENILRVGKADAPKFGNTNKYAEYVDECNGLGAIEDLQNNSNDKIYGKAVQILTTYFESEEDTTLAPAVNNNNQFQFSAPTQPNQQFKFM